MEKNYALLLASALLMATGASAQFVRITDSHGTQVNETQVPVNCTPDVDVADVGFITTSPVSQFVRMRRYEVSVLPGTSNYFCWDECWLPVEAGTTPVWESNGAQWIEANTAFSGAHAYYEPSNIAGTSTFRYVWYSSSDPNDSTWVDVVFNATPAGVEENAGAVRSFNAYPNPSSSGVVTLDYDLAGLPAGSRLVVYNTLGERALTRTLGAAQGRVVLGAGELGAGVWFATIESKGRTVATRRIVVPR
ncbi:MAG: T9SS type A sorting domain-containing protein [Flavobacteriales bacterium]